eukprot:1918064-Rhodomonas_salina.1
MPPRRNTANSAGATANAMTEGQVAMDAPNVPPGTEQVAIDNSTNPNPTTDPTPPISQDAMAAPMGIPSLGQNTMAAPNLGPPNLSQNVMATPNVFPVIQQAISPF